MVSTRKGFLLVSIKGLLPASNKFFSFIICPKAVVMNTLCTICFLSLDRTPCSSFFKHSPITWKSPCWVVSLVSKRMVMFSFSLFLSSFVKRGSKDSGRPALSLRWLSVRKPPKLLTVVVSSIILWVWKFSVTTMSIAEYFSACWYKASQSFSCNVLKFSLTGRILSPKEVSGTLVNCRFEYLSFPIPLRSTASDTLLGTSIPFLYAVSKDTVLPKVMSASLPTHPRLSCSGTSQGMRHRGIHFSSLFLEKAGGWCNLSICMHLPFSGSITTFPAALPSLRLPSLRSGWKSECVKKVGHPFSSFFRSLIWLMSSDFFGMRWTCFREMLLFPGPTVILLKSIRMGCPAWWPRNFPISTGFELLALKL